MPTVAVISARMGSSRLPGKVLMEIVGRPMLSLQVERVRRASTVDRVVVATSVESQDDPVAALCAAEDIGCYRGSEPDVLDRIYQAARRFDADPIVRLTGDDPLADPAVIDRVVGTFLEKDMDYAANVNPPTFPDGLDVEVVSFKTLERVWREAALPEEREHVTWRIRQNMEQYRTRNVTHAEDLSAMHWAVDTRENFSFIKKVFEKLHPEKPNFTMHDVLSIVEEGEIA